MNLKSVLVTIVLLLSACTTLSGSQPKWVNEPTKQYPRKKYLTATGQGRHAQQAVNRARANLARIFTSQVLATTADDNASLRSNGVVSNTQRAAEYITTFTDYTLQGVEIAEQWTDKKSGTVSTLAILNRQAAANRLRDKIHGLDNEITKQLNSAATAKDKLLAVAKLIEALDKQAERDALQQSLRIVDTNGKGQVSRYTQVMLQQSIEKALAAIDIKTQVLSDSMGDIEQLLHAGLQSTGVQLVDHGYDYQLDIQSIVRDRGKHEGWYWQESTLSLTLRDASGQLVNVVEWTLKSAAQSPVRAKERLRQDLSVQIKTQLLGFLLSR